MAELDVQGWDQGQDEQSLVETGLASILDQAATVCERLSADERIADHAGGELKDVLSVLHTMLDRAQELVGELTRELVAARRTGARGIGASDLRGAIDEVLASVRARQEAAIQGVRSYAEQVFNDLSWRVGMLGEQVEAMAASIDAVKPGDAGEAANGAVATALGTFEREVGEFLALFRERAGKAGEAIEAAGRQREQAVLATIERAERAAQIVETIEAAGRERERAVLALIERAERAAVSAPVAVAEAPKPVVTQAAPKVAPKAPARKPGVKTVAARAEVKPPVTVKAKARGMRAAA